MAINSLSSTSKGLSGLASGMDTQSMVDAMLAGTQAKIDKATQSKATLTNKQGIYRNVMTSLKGLQDNFFTYNSKSNTNLLYSSFYNNMKASTNSKYFTANATNNAAQGKTSVNSINQLAQALKYKAKDAASGGVSGKLDLDKTGGGDLIVVLDGVSKTIKMPTPDAGLTGDARDQKFAADLQESITKALGNGITVTAKNGNITFTGGDSTDTSREFQIMGKPEVMDLLGMKTGVSNKMDTRQALSNLNFNTKLNGTAFDFTINGVNFRVQETDTLSDVISKINTSDANVKIGYATLEDKFTIESTISGKDTKIEMSQQEGNLLSAMFGVGEGTSGITGQGLAEQSDIVGKLPGVGSGAPPTADEMQKLIDEMNAQIDAVGKKSKFSLGLNGKEIDLVMPTRPSGDTRPYDLNDLQKAIEDNAELKAAGVTLNLDKTTGEMTLTANKGERLQVGSGFAGIGLPLNTANTKPATGTTTLDAAGLSGMTMDVGGTSLTFTGTETMDEVAKAIQDALVAKGPPANANAKVTFDGTESKGRFRIFGVDIPITIQITGDGNKLFGKSEIKLDKDPAAGVGTADEIAKGQNAILYINNQRVERNSNDFTIEGMVYSLKETFNGDKDSLGNEIIKDKAVSESIDTTRDTDQIFDGISKFMDDYNKIIDTVWTMLKEKTTYKDYPPLSDKQKASMSDKEVELWEKKSMEGLMRSDPALNGIMEAMRSALVQVPAGSNVGLSDLGISAVYDFDKFYGGKLEFNDDGKNGEKLREMITKDPEAIQRLFSDAETGIMTNVNKILTAATTDTVGKKTEYANLSLVNIAGRPGLNDTSSNIYKELKDINDNLANLNTKYKLEYQRYWKQFNAMEQTISNMNQQSSWLSQQLAG